MSEPATTERERLQTLLLASAAFARMRSYGLAHTPRNYKVWYVYLSGTNAALGVDIERAIEKSGGVTSADMDQLHALHFPGENAEAIDDIGAGLKAEIEAVAKITEASHMHTQTFGQCLFTTATTLVSLGPDATKAVVVALQAATSDMRQKNQQTIEMLETHAREIRTLRQSLNAARNDSCTDALTGLANRRQFEMFLAEAIAEATAHDAPLSLLLIDVDHFKSFNDRYGHLTGDQVLRLVAACAGQHIKGQDLAARYGGEEFAVVLPKATGAGARSVAEAIRKSIVSKPLKKKSSGEPLGQVTVSVGIASLRPGDTREQVIERADECLYAAKAAGRNCVVVEDQMPAGGWKDRPAGAVTLEGNTRRAPAIAIA